MKKVLRIFYFILFFSSLSMGQETDLVIEQMTEERKNLLAKEGQRREVLSELYSIHKKMRRISREKGDFESQKQVAKKKAKTITINVKKLAKKIEVQREILKKRLRVHYKVGTKGYASLIFNNHSLFDLDRNLTIIKTISDRDYALLQDYKNNIADYNGKKEALNAELQKIDNLSQKVQAKELALEKEKKTKSVLLTQIDSKKILHLTQLKRLRLESHHLLENKTEVDRLKVLEATLRPSFVEFKGQLGAPIVGAHIGFRFNEAPENLINLSLSTKGLFFSSAVGKEISSVFDGTVIFASKTKGDRNVVVIAHDDQYYSVYGDLSEIKVHRGQEIRQKDLIGLTGTNSFGLGEGLYFEIRHFSEPQDPSDWIRL